MVINQPNAAPTLISSTKTSPFANPQSTTTTSIVMVSIVIPFSSNLNPISIKLDGNNYDSWRS